MRTPHSIMISGGVLSALINILIHFLPKCNVCKTQKQNSCIWNLATLRDSDTRVD